MSDELETPVMELTDDAKAAAKARAEECFAEIEGVLKKHRCRIVPFLVPSTELDGDPIGEISIRAVYGVLPEVV